MIHLEDYLEIISCELTSNYDFNNNHHIWFNIKHKEQYSSIYSLENGLLSGIAGHSYGFDYIKAIENLVENIKGKYITIDNGKNTLKVPNNIYYEIKV